MATPVLDTVTSPEVLKGLTSEELDALAAELRAEMVQACAVNGGHLAPSLGAVEITLAAHRVLNLPTDRLLFDVGHQAYAHKLLTGRRALVENLRTRGGVSGFPKITESEYDSHNAGHASDALSTALGYAMARDLNGEDHHVAVVVGDSAFAGGMSFEALNHIGERKTRLIIILNDNGRSIAKSVGGLSTFLSNVRLSAPYQRFRSDAKEHLGSGGPLGRAILGTGAIMKDNIKQAVVPSTPFFEGFGVAYFGPVDGHNREELEFILERAKKVNGPVLIHAVTTKGKGYAPAEEHPGAFHGISPFDVATGKTLAGKKAASWTKVFSDELIALAREDERVCAITAGMPTGTGLAEFAREFPERCFDTGIAEEHAVGLASGLALGGQVPVVAIYSTFLQRAYDQMIINVALQKQHVVFAIDRGGLVGEDGPTHHGVFDLTYMRSIPGMTVLAPSNEAELRAALRFALACEGPVALRYPRGTAVAAVEGEELCAWELGQAREVVAASQCAILAVGSMVSVAREASTQLAAHGISCAVYDMRFVKPVDVELLERLAAAGCQLALTLEENSVVGGFGSAVLEAVAERGLSLPVMRMGLPDAFIEQGKIPELLESVGLTAENVAATIAAQLH